MSRRTPSDRRYRGTFFEPWLGPDDHRGAAVGFGEAVGREQLDAAERFFEDLVGLRPRPVVRRAPRAPAFEQATTARRVDAAATVRWLQTALNRVQGSGLDVDGVLGPNTKAALRTFAQRQGLRTRDRVVGAVLHRLAKASGTVPPGVWLGAMPLHRGRRPDLSIPCPDPATVLDRFAFASVTPTAAHRVVIDQLAQTIAASLASDQPVHLACIEGHTDAVGAAASNEQLGQRRADAVQDELAAALERTRPGSSRQLGMWSTTAGESQPAAPNTTETNRARNRRVEVRLNRRWSGGQGGATSVTVAALEVTPHAELAEGAEQVPRPRYEVAVGRRRGLVATGRPLPVGNPAYAWVSADPTIATAVPRGTTQTHPNGVDITGVRVGATTVTVTYQPSVGPPTSTIVDIVVIAAPAPVAMVDRYGCHDLRRGDRDTDPADANRPRWGGVAGASPTVCVPAPAVPPVNPTHVRQLQEDLRSLGFLIVGTPSGVFDRNTEWAVREFQVYAKMTQIARIRAGVAANLRRGAHLVAAALGHHAASNTSEYVHSLESFANDAVYAGPVSGVVDAQTRTAIDHWLTNDWRCPVVIEAWRMNGAARAAPVAINLWAHDSHASTAHRMFARDFTSYYTFPAGRNTNDMQVIGDFATYLTWSGPRSVPPRHTWSEGEILPAALVGNAAPAGATLSTYRVVRAVAEVECIGFYDSVNCYDNAFVSVGPCHWTLGIISATGAFSEGELCGYLAYLRNTDNAAFQAAIEFFGVRIDENWVSAAGPADGADLFSAAQRKYTGWVALQQHDGSFARLAQTEADGNYFKTWHWHYRFVMAGRTIAGYRERMWHMARVRVRDILAVPWGPGVAQVGAGTPGARAATIGDVFTSERAVAMLLRWHIRFPAHVVSGGQAAARLRNALTNARAAGATLNWAGDPSAWTNAHEGHLIDGILTAATASVRASLTYVRDWPNWLGGANPRGFALAAPVAAALDADRGSLDFDTANLPPAPP